MRTKAIDRIAIDSPEIDERIRAGVPFVTHVHWRAHDTWNVEYLKRTIVPKQVRIYKKDEQGRWPQVWIDIREYFDIVGKPGFGENYDVGAPYDFRLWEAGEPDPNLGPLLEDLQLPPFLRPETRLNVNFWCATGSHETPCHYDPNSMHNMNFQITGRKRFRLFAPEAAGALGVHPALQSLHPPLWSNMTEPPDSRADRPDYANVECHDTWLEPGDAVFIPSFFMHWVTYEPGDVFHSSINTWFRPERQYLRPIQASWAFVNGVIAALQRKHGPMEIPQLIELINGMDPATRELLQAIETVLLERPDLLTYEGAMALRGKAVIPTKAPP